MRGTPRAYGIMDQILSRFWDRQSGIWLKKGIRDREIFFVMTLVVETSNHRKFFRLPEQGKLLDFLSALVQTLKLFYCNIAMS